MKNIFKELELDEITFAVYISYKKPIFNWNMSVREFYIMINRKDISKPRHHKKYKPFFYRNNIYFDVYDKKLNSKEIKWFLRNVHKYKMVVNNEHGRVYETPSHSFKEEYRDAEVNKSYSLKLF